MSTMLIEHGHDFHLLEALVGGGPPEPAPRPVILNGSAPNAAADGPANPRDLTVTEGLLDSTDG